MATTTPNYAVDYEDKRLTSIKSEEQTQLEQNAQMYDGMIQGVDTQYQGIADTIQSNADKLAQTQQENTDFQVQQIEQQKQQAQKDYTKEQSGAYADWQKQSNQYGVNAEQMAMQGLSGSGYSESSKVAMFNQYQNRVAVARESLSKVIMNYDNNIQQAILQNNSTIAQIQSEASLKQAEILLEGFNQKNLLLQQQMERELQLKAMYQDKWQSELNQINTENALAEQVRQAQLQQERWAEEQRIAQEQWQKEYELAKTEAERQAKLQERQMQLAESEHQATYGENGTIAQAKQQQQQQQIEKEAEAKGGAFGNNASTVNKEDYYFSNGYQPRYVNNQKLAESGIKSNVLPDNLGIPDGQNVWKAGGQYYAWSGKDKTYINVTENLVFSNGYQPKYIGNNELKSAGTIKGTIGSYGNLPTSQKVWKAGSKYYVWDGSSRTYKDVTSQYNKYLNKQTGTNKAINDAVMNVYGGGNVWL